MSYLTPVEDDTPAPIPVEESTAPAVVVPHKMPELLAQLSLANPKDNPTSFVERMGNNDRQVRTYGSTPSLSEVWMAEREEKLGTLRQMVSAAAAQENAEYTQRLINEIGSIEATQQEISMVEAYRATAKRAFENATAPAAIRMGADPTKFATAMEVEADYAATRQMLHQAAAKAGVDATFWEKLSAFGQEVVPGVHLLSRWRQNKAIAESLGIKDTPFDKEEAISNFRNLFLGMPPEERVLVVNKLMASSLGAFGGKNSAALNQLLEELVSPSTPALQLEKTFDVLGVADIALLGVGIGKLLQRGAASIGLATGDKTTAGKLLAEDLLTKGNLAGEGTFSLVSKAFAAGQDPFYVGHPSLQGLSTSMQETLATRINELYRNLAERLPTSGVTKDEVDMGIAKLREGIAPEANKAIHSVLYGEGDAKGLKSIVYLQDEKTGRWFSSREAAEATNAANGGRGVVVPYSSLADDVKVRPDIAYHGSGAEFDEFKAAFVGKGEGWQSLGHGFSTSTNKAFAKSYAETYGRTSVDGPVLYTVDIPSRNGMMDWFAPISEQGESVQRGLAKVLQADELKALKESNGTAGDAYLMVADRTGDRAATSKMFDEAGIKGAFTADETTVYNPKDIAIVEKQFIERKTGKKELSDEERLRKQQEEEWINSGYGPDGQPLDESNLEWYKEVSTKRVTAAPREPVPIPETWEGILPITPTIWEKGKWSRNTPGVTFTGDVPPKVRAYVMNLRRIMGMPKDRSMVIANASEETFAKLIDEFPEIEYKWREIKEMLVDGANGIHLNYGKHEFILMHATAPNTLTEPGSFRYIKTLTHELGHSFDWNILRKAYSDKRIRPELIRMFKQWSDDRVSAGDYFIQHSVVDAGQIEDILNKGLDVLPKREVGRLVSPIQSEAAAYVEWAGMFEEWWANQFSKYVLSSKNTTPLLAKYFEEIKKILVATANYFLSNKKLMKMYGDDLYVDAMHPHEFVKQFLDTHIEMVRTGTVPTSTKGTNYEAGTFVRPYVHSAIATESASVAGKPRIKLKSKPDEKWLIREERLDPLPYDVVGKFSKQDIDSMPWIAVDPKHQASELAVEARVVGVHAEAKVKTELSSFIKPFYDKLDNTSKAKVKGVLDEGDSKSNLNGSTGREFSYMELKAKGLSEDEAAAYFATRQLRQTMYHLHNGEKVRHLRAQGMKEVETEGQKLVGKRLETVGEALSAHVNQGIYNVAQKKMVFYRQGDMEEAYAKGERVVKLQHPAEIDGKLYSTLVVDNENAKIRDIYTALNYRPGEFSRIYTDEYFIRMISTKEVDGLSKEVVDTVRTAASAREAGDFVNAMKQAVNVLRNNEAASVAQKQQLVEPIVGKYFNVDEFMNQWNEGKFAGFKDMEFSYSRNKDEYLNGSVAQAQFEGRLFTDKRGDKLFSVDVNRANTLDVNQSLEAEITNISRVVNIGEWRETLVRRWMNTFGDLLPNRTGNDVADFYSAANATFTKGSKDALFAERTHKYIMRQIGVRTQEEQFYQAVTRRWTEAFFQGGEKVESVGAAIRQQDWLGFIRSVNFNFNLGMFNPAQLIVQANGAATAIVLSPKHGLAAAKTFPLLRLGLMSDNPQVWDKLATVENLTSLGLSNKEEFVSLIKAIRKTGILDNTKSTALHNLEDGKLNIFAGYPSKVWGSHAFFFNRGEEFGRVVSFDVARREWMAANPGKDWTKNEAVAQMVVRMDDLTQNMTKANLARWQEGALSIPMQFAQYNIKLGANIVSAFMSGGKGRGFTRTEAATLMAGHVLLYGAAGNGLSWLVDEVVPEEVKAGMSQAAKAYVAQGLLSGLVYHTSEALTGEGANVATGTRLGSFDYYQRIATAIFKDPANVYSALLGPTLGTAKRLGVIGDVAYLWWKDPNLTGRDVTEGLSKMTAEQVATLRNATKAYLFYQHQGKFLDSKGIPLGDVTPVEIMGQLLGMQPTVAVDVHNLIKNKKEHTEAINDIAKLVMNTQRAIVFAASKGDMARAEEQQKLLLALWPNNAGDAMEVARIVRDRLYPYDTEMQKLLGDYMLKGMQYTQPITPTTPPQGTK